MIIGKNKTAARKLCYILIFLSYGLFTLAQTSVNHMKNWHFGNKCSIDFNTTTPTPGTSNLNSYEGCATISDVNTGNLLFYTDGKIVYDKLGNVMPNGTGLFGDNSSAQSAIIIPKSIEGSGATYYIFTTDQAGYLSPNKGVYYSIVDMSLNNGLGDITVKNSLVFQSNAEERIAAVRACNGVDFWLITHKFQTDSFFVFPITQAGVGTPVISKVGSVYSNISGQFYEGIGCLAVSPDGDRVALTVYYFQSIVEMFYFDQFTGKLSNSITINKTDLNTSDFEPYGIAFSPDSKKLYFTNSNETLAGLNAQIYQVDISAWNKPAIIASTYIVSSINNNNYWNVALGPDNKIYVAKGYYASQKYIDVVNNPNNSGAACGFVLDGFQIPNGVEVRNGLPSFYKELLPGDISCSATSINEYDKSNVIWIFPNPVQDNIYLKNISDKEIFVQIYDILGRKMLSKMVNGIIPVAHLEKGTYFLFVGETKDGSIFKTKFIKD